MRRRLLAAFGVACVFAGACLLEIPDVKDGGSVDGGNDSTSDVVLPDVIVPACDAACGAPAGFQPLLFALNRNTTCPTGTQSTDLAADPGSVPPSACTCDCNVTNPPACTPSTLTHTLDQFASSDGGFVCSSTGSDQLVDGGCNMIDGGGLHIYAAWSVPPITPVEAGTCTSAVTTNVNNVASTPSRICVDQTCNSTCTAPTGFRACLFATGKAACPSGYPEQHQVGTLALNCNACSACGVSLDGGCRGSATLYQDNFCLTALETIPLEGGCAANSANGATAGSIRYTPALSGLTCTPGTSTGTVSLAGEYTVCCP